MNEATRAQPQIRDRILKGQVRRVYDEIGDRWTCLILLSLFSGVNSFESWLTTHGISPGILSNRLKNLVSGGLLTRKQSDSDARRVEYALTTKGKDLYLWVLAVWQWESRWVFRDSAHPAELLDQQGRQIHDLSFTCAHCGTPVNFYTIDIERGPAYDTLPVLKSNNNRKSRNANLDQKQPSHQLGSSMDIIGDRWNFLIISASYFGVTRFDQFQSELDMATNTLANRLSVLTNSGMLAKNRYKERPARYEYILTQKTIDFYQIPLMLALWGDRWMSTEEGDVFIRRHTSCGNRLEIKPVSVDYQQEITPDDFQVRNTAAELDT